MSNANVALRSKHRQDVAAPVRDIRKQSLQDASLKQLWLLRCLSLSCNICILEAEQRPHTNREADGYEVGNYLRGTSGETGDLRSRGMVSSFPCSEMFCGRRALPVCLQEHRLLIEMFQSPHYPPRTALTVYFS